MAVSTPSLPELVKKTRCSLPPASCDQPLRQLRGELRHVALQHGGTGAVQFFLERGDDGGMIVSGVVYAVAGEEIENAAAIGGEEFRRRAAFVLHVHLQKVEQLDPLRIDVVGVETVERRIRWQP